MEIICGIDEAGRGPLAGPVTAAAVVLPERFPVELLADSKALSQQRRRQAEAVVRQEALLWGIGWAWPVEIDQLNIHHASLLAMVRAYANMVGPLLTDSDNFCLGRPASERGGCDLHRRTDPTEALIDGRFTPELPVQSRAIVKGDTLIPQIQAASILAKTARDRWMEEYACIEPQYRFEKHKGYPTAEHRELIGEYGTSRIHRHSFRAISGSAS